MLDRGTVTIPCVGRAQWSPQSEKAQQLLSPQGDVGPEFRNTEVTSP